MATDKPNVSVEQLLDGIAGVLECVGENEGTVFESQWRKFGVTEELENIMLEALERKYNER
jgi:hypothetical protein